jgi:lipoprotein-releasing system ATP-binding protein
MIQTESLTFAYTGNTTMNFPNVSIKKAETLLILGKSGVGKTTFLHLLALLLKPDTGQIFINNTDANKLKGDELASFRSKSIGLIFQKPHFVSSLTVKENLLLTNYLANAPLNESFLKELSQSLGIEQLLHKKTNQLSLGEQQRVAIARAMMNNPSVIFADEPSSSLDDENCKIVIDLLQNQAKKIGASLIIVTHDQRLKNVFPNQISL